MCFTGFGVFFPGVFGFVSVLSSFEQGRPKFGSIYIHFRFTVCTGAFDYKNH